MARQDDTGTGLAVAHDQGQPHFRPDPIGPTLSRFAPPDRSAGLTVTAVRCMSLRGRHRPRGFTVTMTLASTARPKLSIVARVVISCTPTLSGGSIKK